MQIRKIQVVVFVVLLILIHSCKKDTPPDTNLPDTRMGWYFKETEGNFGKSAPAVADDGTIYVGTSSNSGFTGDISALGLYALNPDGTVKWKYSVGADVYTPAIGPDGTIYFQDRTNKLYALTSSGSLKWVIPGGSGDRVKSPAIGSDGTIYIAIDYFFYAFEPSGTEKWSTYMDLPHVENCSSPSIGPDGTIYYGTSNPAHFYAFNPSGTIKWQFAFQNTAWMFSTPAIDNLGNIYVGVEQGDGGDSSWVYAFNPDSTIKWIYTITDGRDIRSSPVIGADGTIYIGTSGFCNQTGGFLAINSNGTKKWEYSVTNYLCEDDPDHIYFTAALGSDGLIYLGAGNTSNLDGNLITAVDNNGNKVWEWNAPDSHGGFGSGISSSPAIVGDKLYVALFDNPVGIGDGIFYALNTTSNGLANSSWPKFRHDLKNTGRVGP